MSEPRLFAQALGRHLRAWILGSSPAAILQVAAWLRLIPQPSLAFWMFFLAAGFAVAAFRAWREEHRLVATRQGQIDELITAAELAAQEPIPDVDDQMYWLLAVVQKNTMRRQSLDLGSVKANPIWIGDFPTDGPSTAWLQHLVLAAVDRGWLEHQTASSGQPRYPLSEDGRRILAAGRRIGRIPVQPSEILDARAGQPKITPAT